MSDRRNVCVLASGGIDSAVALSEAIGRAERVVPVYVRAGLVWERAEIYWLERFLQTIDGDTLEPLVILDLPVRDLYGDHWSVTAEDPPDGGSGDDAVYLPGRNILLLSKVGVFACERGCDALILGPLANNPFPDATPTFFDAMARAIGEGMGRDRPLPIHTPLVGLSKAEVIRRGAGSRLDLTFSCIDPRPDHVHCGACNKCAERRRGFVEAEVEDPTAYAGDGRDA